MDSIEIQEENQQMVILIVASFQSIKHGLGFFIHYFY